MPNLEYINFDLLCIDYIVFRLGSIAVRIDFQLLCLYDFRS